MYVILRFCRMRTGQEPAAESLQSLRAVAYLIFFLCGKLSIGDGISVGDEEGIVAETVVSFRCPADSSRTFSPGCDDLTVGAGQRDDGDEFRLSVFIRDIFHQSEELLIIFFICRHLLR